MDIWKKVKPLFEAGEHLHFGATILDLVFDWRVWIPAMGGGILTLFTAAYDGHSVTDVLLSAAIGIGAFALLAAGILSLWRAIHSPVQLGATLISAKTPENINPPNNAPRGRSRFSLVTSALAIVSALSIGTWHYRSIPAPRFEILLGESFKMPAVEAPFDKDNRLFYAITHRDELIKKFGTIHFKPDQKSTVINVIIKNNGRDIDNATVAIDSNLAITSKTIQGQQPKFSPETLSWVTPLWSYQRTQTTYYFSIDFSLENRPAGTCLETLIISKEIHPNFASVGCFRFEWDGKP
jgi:hypothetical protein